jgi:hypothetical protein
LVGRRAVEQPSQGGELHGQAQTGLGVVRGPSLLEGALVLGLLLGDIVGLSPVLVAQHVAMAVRPQRHTQHWRGGELEVQERYVGQQFRVAVVVDVHHGVGAALGPEQGEVDRHWVYEPHIADAVDDETCLTPRPLLHEDLLEAIAVRVLGVGDGVAEQCVALRWLERQRPRIER